MPKGSRKKQEIDVSRFQPLVTEALKAFASHVAYAEAMMRQAVTIERKRSVHRIRRDVKKAEADAKASCDKRKFRCVVDTPCGTGECPFAPDDLADIEIYAPGTTERPRNGFGEPYSIEPVVKFLQDQAPRSATRPECE